MVEPEQFSGTHQENGTPLLIRADASPDIGTGHVMRCLALSQAWRESIGPVFYAMARSTNSIAKRLDSEHITVHRLDAEPGSPEDSEQTSALAKKIGAAWVVLDNYYYFADYQLVLRNAGLKVLTIDDTGELETYHSHLVLNQNLHASDKYYRDRPASTRLLLGPQYTLLREEFTKRPVGRVDSASEKKRLLVTFGGADAPNMTGRVVKALADLSEPALQINLLIGPANPRYREVETLISHCLNDQIRIMNAVEDMRGLMAETDLAISAAGSTVWELMYMGIPSIVVALADNQVLIAEKMAEFGCGINLGRHENISPDDIQKAVLNLVNDPDNFHSMRRTGRRIIDGRGAHRVIDAMRLAAS